MAGGDQRPLTREEVIRVLLAIEKHTEESVLVGGQAVAWWTLIYQGRGQITGGEHPLVSNDVDCINHRSLRNWVALKSEVNAVAEELGGTPHHAKGPDPILAAFIEFSDDDQEDRRLDFMASVKGVDGGEILRTAVTVAAIEGLPTIALMHPVLVLESRVANVVEIPDKYATHVGLSQARAAVLVAREGLREELDLGWGLAKTWVRRLLGIAGSPNGIAILRDHGIDVLDAIPGHPELDERPRFRDDQLRRVIEQREKMLNTSS